MAAQSDNVNVVGMNAEIIETMSALRWWVRVLLRPGKYLGCMD